MANKHPSESTQKPIQQNFPAFQRRYEFLLWFQIILFIGVFSGIMAHQVIRLDQRYWDRLQQDFLVYSKQVSPDVADIVNGDLQKTLDYPGIQAIEGGVFIFNADFTHPAAAAFETGNNAADHLKQVLLSNSDRLSRMPDYEFFELDHWRIFKSPLSNSSYHLVLMISPPPFWIRIAHQFDVMAVILYSVLLLVFGSTVFLVHFRYVLPTKKLTEYIIAKHRGIQTDAATFKSVPQEWRPWFNIISWLFERMGVSEKKMEATHVDQQLGTNLLRRFSWVFERNEKLTRELTAKNIELEEEIELHKKTTLELKRHRDHLNEMVRERATDLYHANIKLESAIKKTEAANQAKSQFLANMSHSIRTPLNAMIGFTELLVETRLNETQREFVQTIQHSSETLLSLINDILDLSKIESGGITLETIDFSIELMAHDVCEMLRPAISKKSVELGFHIDNNVPAYVKGDSHRFQQILINLLNNASKFTETGEILFSISVDQEEADRVLIHCKIKDTGIGISEDKLELIFDPFQQADGSTTRKYGGTGLGLPIAGKLAVMMDGKVFVESEPEVGSTFHFTAWLEKSLKKESWQALTTGLSGKQVLIVDNNQVHLDMLANALRSAQILVVDLKNGVEVLPTIQRAILAGKSFDCCIIDIHMPGMDGYEIARNIRSSNDPMIAKIPLIASSALNQREPVLFAKAGYNQSFIKPVRREKLFQILREVLILGGSAQSEEMFHKATALAASSPKPLRRIRILVAEDDPHNQKLIKIMLEQMGCYVTLVSNGREAVDQFYDTPYYYDLIFLDIQMPVIDGFGAFRMIRKINARVPVIAFTAHAMKEHHEQCLKIGMNDFLTKPIRKEALVAVINRFAPIKSNPTQ